MSALIKSNSAFDALRREDERGEYWTGRDLMAAVEYDKWERFEDAIERARVALVNVGEVPDEHASRLREPSGQTTRVNYRLTRYGAYMVVMNGDSRKPAIAAAQSYFAIRTREAEVKGVGTADLPAIPQTYAEALRAAADQADRADKAEAKVAELEPKADLADTFLIADGSTRLVREVAKLLGIKEGDLRRFLLDEKLIFVKHAPCGVAMYDFYASFSHHFMVKENPVEHTFGLCSHYTLRITARGVELIRKRMRDAEARRELVAVAR